ncbi:hypothetical protein CROQUDRAFT_657923 [Cronartium quercuum f. sp. fusiforme G11]|uniref:glucan endo-1,3-beta-D-glucosidase n=1 Tax=Cronartium quercuum f. sp. fusiforme G11 TaxID=708437 RepID=A0A9P6NFL7_9BASI|nr:hypothetical protein CROQUDRAFT_657923 [Cronartium quercuum f. sp. fusiforme G11]
MNSFEQFKGELFNSLDSNLIKSPPYSHLFGKGQSHPKQHPIKISISSSSSPPPPPGTNKWYTQLILQPNGTEPIYPLPYALAYLNGTSLLSNQSTLPYLGLGISHSTNQQIVYGPPISNQSEEPVKFYLNPLIISFCFSASELNSQNITSNLSYWSELVVHFNITCQNVKGTNHIHIPICRGSAFITLNYLELTPIIRSTLAIINVFQEKELVNDFKKYKIDFNDQSTWLLYSKPNLNGDPNLDLKKMNQNTLIHNLGKWNGIIQIVKMSENYNQSSSNIQRFNEESIYDRGVGVWVDKANISSDSIHSGSYSFNWYSKGPRARFQSPLIFALPHHLEALVEPTKGTEPIILLNSRVTGQMKLLESDKWLFKEDMKLIKKFNILPKNPNHPNLIDLSPDQKVLLTEILIKELEINFESESNLNSYYFAGKKIAKQALQCLTAKYILKDDDLTFICLEKTKKSLLQFSNNTKRIDNQLIYDQTWKGLISSSMFKSGNEHDDFGNGVYNDHHFHFSYFIHAASILVHLDSNFLKEVEVYINNLIRDVNNSSTNDFHFPLFRYFDWFLGHSLATGLVPSLDGKNQESCSEDINFLYSLKTWSEVIKNENLLNLSELQLCILNRSIQNYYLIKDDNLNIPKSFKSNKVPGILFENKSDYTAFFSNQIDAIHMIQVIPITPITPFFRAERFIEEEWNSKISEIAQSLKNGYCTLLFLQYSIINPKLVLHTMMKFLKLKKEIPLDDGLSLSWCFGFIFSQLDENR